MDKKAYISPEIEGYSFEDEEDVITTSPSQSNEGDNDLKDFM